MTRTPSNTNTMKKLKLHFYKKYFQLHLIISSVNKRYVGKFTNCFIQIKICEITRACFKSSCWLVQVFLCYQLLTWSRAAKRVRGQRSATPGARHLTSLIYIHADLHPCDSCFCFCPLNIPTYKKNYVLCNVEVFLQFHIKK